MKEGDISQYMDKGFVELIQVSGDQRMVAGGARASYNDEAYYDEKKNKGLLEYLVEHFHTSPLELVSLTFRIKLPLFVVAQHVRHRMAKQNHQSLRYVKQDGDYYVPKYDRICGSHSHNKQGSGDPLPRHIQELFVEDLLKKNCEESWRRYCLAVDAGVSKETARMLLPSNFYTTIVWQMDLSNLCKYLVLRTDSHAQAEIQELACILELAVKENFPDIYTAYLEYMKNSVTFSATEVEYLKNLVKNEDLDRVIPSGKIRGSARRFDAFKTKLGL